MNKDKIGKLRWLAQRALYCGSNRTKHYFEIQNHQIFFIAVHLDTKKVQIH